MPENERQPILSEAPEKTEAQQRQDAHAQQILDRVKRIINRKNTQFILDHQHDSLEELSKYLQAFAHRKIVRDLCAALEAQEVRA